MRVTGQLMVLAAVVMATGCVSTSLFAVRASGNIVRVELDCPVP